MRNLILNTLLAAGLASAGTAQAALLPAKNSQNTRSSNAAVASPADVGRSLLGLVNGVLGSAHETTGTATNILYVTGSSLQNSNLPGVALLIAAVNLPDPNGHTLPGVTNAVIGSTYGLLGSTAGIGQSVGRNLRNGNLPGLDYIGIGLDEGFGVVNTGVNFISNVRIRTTWKSPTGALVVRDHRVVPAVPLPLNVDGDVLPEYLATITVDAYNAFVIRLDKSLFAEQVIPLKMELIVPNPAGTGANSLVSAGFDALDTSAPSNWSATLTLRDLADPVHFSIDVRTRNADRRYALAFALYDQLANGTRLPSIEARASFEPVPTANTYDVVLGDERQIIGIASDTRSILSADAAIYGEDGSQQSFSAVLNRLPTDVSLQIDAPQGRFSGVSYHASHHIDAIDVVYESPSVISEGPGAGLPLTAHAVVHDVPTDLGIQIASDAATGTKVEYSASSQIGSIDFTLDNFPLLPNARTIVSRIENLPSRMTMEIPTDGSSLARFNAHGEAIGSAFAIVTGDLSVLSRPGVNAGFRNAPGNFHENFAFDQTSDGITLREWSDTFLLMARLSGLRSADIVLEPNVRAALDVDPNLARPFGVSVRQWHETFATSQGFDYLTQYYEGYISNIPSHLLVVMPEGNVYPSEDENPENESQVQRIQFSAGNRIDLIDLRSNFGNSEMYGRLTIRDLPTELDLCLGTSNSGRECVRPRRAAAAPFLDPIGMKEPTLIAIDIDDKGSTTNREPWVVDGRFCFDQVHPDLCENNPVVQRSQDAELVDFDVRFQNSNFFMDIDNLSLHNWSIGLYAERCNVAFLCGHFDGDTRRQLIDGNIRFFGYRLARLGGLDYSVDANIVLNSLWMDQRYINFNAHSVVFNNSFAAHAQGPSSIHPDDRLVGETSCPGGGQPCNGSEMSLRVFSLLPPNFPQLAPVTALYGRQFGTYYPFY